MLLPLPFTSTRAYANALASFANSPLFKTLTVDVHHLDLFTALNPWSKLPVDWQVWFDACTDERELELKLADVRSGKHLPGRPASLTEHLKLSRTLPLPRDPPPKDNSTSPGLLQDLLAGMSPKKQVEVRHFRDLVFDLARRTHMTNVVDIGAGQGYLSRTLCHRPDRPASPPVASPPPIQVLAIDGSPTQIRGSQAFGDKASTASPITYLVQRIEGADSASSEISSWLTTRGDGRGIIIGLHACGKLTDDTIGMFLRTEGIKGLVVVGCCYNHLGSGPGPGCFPTSALFKELQVALSSTARMAGCQNVTRWEDDPASTPQALQKREELRRVSRERAHFRRLLTPLLLHPLLPPTPLVIPLGAMPKSSLQNFRSYASTALTKLDLLRDLSATDQESILTEADRLEREFSDWKWGGRGRVLEALSKTAGGVVESTIAIDRLLFLEQQESVKNADLVVGWEYETSPRNLVLVAEKH